MQNKPNATPVDPDRACWLYIYNNVTRDIQNRRYKGDREHWKDAISKHLGQDAALITGCVRVKAPPGEMRLVLDCPSKSSRRQLYEGIRNHKGDIRCNISMTKAEYTNKQEVYCSAARLKLHIKDKGDMMIISNPQGHGLINKNRIWLDRTPASIE